MEGDSAPLSLTPELVANLAERGVGGEDIIRLLVATGTWSEAGAAEIVATLAHRSGGSGSVSAEPVRPGPLEDVPPLFAT